VCSRVGAAEHGDLVPQYEDLDAQGRGRAAHLQDQSEHLQEDQIYSRSDTPAIMPNSWANADHRRPAGYATFWNPTPYADVRAGAMGARRPGAGHGLGW
jgi:hypothetical protein